jgi:GNAT superfamily N-acetyltransferase
MEEILTLERVKNRAWPEEFSGAWANIMVSYLGNIVFSLYFNDVYPEGTVQEDNNYSELPDAYISIAPNGEIYEIYVLPPFRGRGVGAMMCAWTRTNFIDRGIVVTAPDYMTDAAKGLYNYISLEYGEPYNNPGPCPIFNVYLDFGGRSVVDVERTYFNKGE